MSSLVEKPAQNAIKKDVAEVKSGFMKLAGHVDAFVTKMTEVKWIKDFKKNSPNAYLVTAALIAAVALVAISSALSYVSIALYVLAGAIVLYSALKAGGKKWFPDQTQKAIATFETTMESLYGKFKTKVSASGEEQKTGLLSKLNPFSKKA